MSKKSLLLQIHRDLAGGNLKLPTLPEVSLKIKRAAVDPNTDLSSLSKVAETDPAFCGYLIQISNSPIYRGVTEIQKVPLAIGRLGLTNTRNIAMTYAIRSLFSRNKKVMLRWLKEVWFTSTYTAAVASVIAEKMSLFDPDEAILGGLLQDIGCLPLIDKAAHYPELIDDEQAMQFLFQRYAATVGAAIVRQWGLSEAYVSVAQNRDNWKYNEVTEANLTDLVLIAKMHTYLGRPQLSPIPRINRTPSFIKLQLEAQLTPEHSLQIVADAKDKIAETRRAIGGN